MTLRPMKILKTMTGVTAMSELEGGTFAGTSATDDINAAPVDKKPEVTDRKPKGSDKTTKDGNKPWKAPDVEKVRELYGGCKYTVKVYNDGRIRYSDRFYDEMYRLVHDEGRTYIEAYNELGYSTDVLGIKRAEQAGFRSIRHAMEKAMHSEDIEGHDYFPSAGGYSEEFGHGLQTREEALERLCAREEFAMAVMENDFPFLRKGMSRGNKLSD